METGYRKGSTNAYRTFIILQPFFISERLRSHFKWTLQKDPTRSVMTSACTAWEFAADTHLMELQQLQKVSPYYWQNSKEHSD